MLGAIRVLLSLPIDIIIAILRYYVFGGSRSRRYKNSLLNCVKLRIFRRALTAGIMEGKWLTPYSNSLLVRRVIPFLWPDLVRGVPGYGEKFDENSMWLVKQPDRKPSDPVIIYAHGGGYFIQTMPLQLTSVLSIYKLLDDDKQKKTSILLLDYKLVCNGFPFPTQLNQLHDTYTRLTFRGNDNIVLMGDSAGGHLSVAYTQFLKTLEEEVVFPRQLVLVSPWLKLNPLPSDIMEGNSWVENARHDFIHHSTFADFRELCHLVGKEDFNGLITSPGGKTPRLRSDWADIPSYSNPDYKVFILLGEDETFRDDILQWAKYSVNLPWYLNVKYGDLHKYLEKQHYEFERRNQPGEADLTVFVEPLGVHDALFFFEDTVASQLKRDIRAGRKTLLKDIDEKEYFAIARVTRFLNETL